jgi:hypothetical protein
MKRTSALVARFDASVESAAFTQRELPLDHVDEVVELQQVELIDAEALERAPDLLARSLVFALARLARQEEVVAVLLQPRREP